MYLDLSNLRQLGVVIDTFDRNESTTVDARVHLAVEPITRL